jgi:Uma2 family endonuclease
MTLQEFLRLPEAQDGTYELRWGELIKSSPAKNVESGVKRRVYELLEQSLAQSGYVDTELGFQPTPEYNFRTADVAFVTSHRWQETSDDSWLSGAPDLVVEVVSASNTARELDEKEEVYLQNGCKSFWAVSPERKTVKVATPDGITRTYRAGSEISLSDFGGAPISVGQIFAE